ncbi:MAG: TIM barrel protein, partial [Bacteroidota bacterium]
IGAVEYTSQFFRDEARDTYYLKEMNKRAADNGVKQLLISVDNIGNLGASDKAYREEVVNQHYDWINAAKFLGCHAIRVNAYGEENAEKVSGALIEALGQLAEYAKVEGINILVENQEGHPANSQWLTNVVRQVGMENCGTLPNFNNFCIRRESGRLYEGPCVEEYDKYKGVAEMMPYAKGVNAKAYDFDADGKETTVDYRRMLQIIKEQGYKGHIGIKYTGNRLSEEAGILATRDLLLKIGGTLS